MSPEEWEHAVRMRGRKEPPVAGNSRCTHTAEGMWATPRGTERAPSLGLVGQVDRGRARASKDRCSCLKAMIQSKEFLPTEGFPRHECSHEPRPGQEWRVPLFRLRVRTSLPAKMTESSLLPRDAKPTSTGALRVAFSASEDKLQQLFCLRFAE